MVLKPELKDKSMIGKLYCTLVCVAVICGCQEFKLPRESAIYSLASVVRLNPDTTVVVLSDYVLQPENIQKIQLPGSIQYWLSDDQKELVLIAGAEVRPMENLSFTYEGYVYDIPLLKSIKETVVFSFDPQGKTYANVQLAGDMNSWNAAATPLVLTDGLWKGTFDVAPGRYQYLVVVDGQKILDPANPEKVNNNAGGKNSLLVVGGESGETPAIETDKLEGDNIFIRSEKQVDEWFVYLENRRLPAAFLTRGDNGLKIRIPEGMRSGREEMRIYAINNSGVSNDILLPLEAGRVITDAAGLNRFDKRASTLYFLMVDRFNNGDTNNDRPLNSKEVLPIADYQGGDLSGVLAKLKEGYFEKMGINTIWLSPITQNPDGAYGLWKNPKTKFSAYHGYWPISSSKVDYRFGTDDELKELVKEAHDRDINIILDYVANHVHEEHPLYKQHKDWATPLYLPDGTLNTEKWDEHRLTTWFDNFLPTLDLEREEVYQPMSDSALYWIKEFGLDGFRHDATKHIPEVFWRTLTYKIKKEVLLPERTKIYQVGETYGSRELIASYVGSGQMDGQFDFNVYDDAVPVFALPQESFKRLHNSLEESFKYYGRHNMMAYISGNQDRGRFISYASGDLRFDEDAKAAGWTRKIGVKNEDAYDKLIQLIAFNSTIPGIPVIYYGDEIGMPGGNDPDNRRVMRFDGLSERESVVRRKTARLNTFRRSSMPLMYGSFNLLRIEDKIYAYTRDYFDKTVIVAFNKSDEAKTIVLDIPEKFRDEKLNSLFHTRFSFSGSKLVLDIPANGVEILFN